MKNSLNTYHNIYQVKFRSQSNSFIFDNEGDTLATLIKENGKHGIDWIKIFDNAKGSFRQLSKAQIKNSFAFDQETLTELKKVNFIK